MSKDYAASVTMAIGWDRIHQDSRRLAAMLRPRGPFRGIVAVARGGLVPAAVLSRELDLRLVETVCVASYDDRRQGSVTVLKSLAGDGEGWLVVDDLVDSGTTAGTVRRMLPRALFACVYAKPEGRRQADVYAVDVEQDVWLVFPWDPPM
ncbi:MAG: xanthine phosphoribosyltransferase [Alphaproteobacteria bacterium]|nr:xanthine phosphoribosyltransferase [Alphaproteobacteria bacterium]